MVQQVKNHIDYARDGELVRLRLQEELSLEAIGQIAGISRERVRQILSFHLGSTGKKAEPKNAWDKGLDRELWQTELLYLPQTEIAAKLKMGISQVQLRRNNLHTNPTYLRKKDMKEGYLRCGGYTLHTGGRKVPCCERRLPLSQFTPEKGRSTGYSCYCSNCLNDYQQEHRQAMRHA